MSRLIVKICGLQRMRDVQAAVRFGADALGFVFAASPRRLELARAVSLTECVPDGIMRVGLFMDPSIDEVESVLNRVPLDLLQFHGREDNALCRRFGVPFLKAISMRQEDPQGEARRFPDAAGLLLDSHAPGERGGTGCRFDWGMRLKLEHPVWLAGGLDPQNVAEAVRSFKPYAVDVSSGVEDAPGVKNHEAIRMFIEAARQAVTS